MLCKEGVVMKSFSSKYLAVFLFFSCCPSALKGISVYFLNKTGRPIWIEERYIPSGLLFPYKKIGSWLQDGSLKTTKAYRIDSICIRNVSESTEAGLVSRVVSVQGDSRISKLCDNFVQEGLESKNYCRNRWLDELTVKLSEDGEIKPISEDVSTAIRLVITRHINGKDFIVTQVGVGTALDQMFEPGKFLEYLKSQRLPAR